MKEFLAQLAADLAAVDLEPIVESKADNAIRRTEIEEATARADAEALQLNERIKAIKAGPDAQTAADALMRGRPAGEDLIDVERLEQQLAAVVAGRTELRRRLEALPHGRAAYRLDVDALTGDLADDVIDDMRNDLVRLCQAVASKFADSRAIEIAIGSASAGQFYRSVEPLLVAMAERGFIGRDAIPVDPELVEALEAGREGIELGYRGIITAAPFPATRSDFSGLHIAAAIAGDDMGAAA